MRIYIGRADLGVGGRGCKHAVGWGGNKRGRSNGSVGIRIYEGGGVGAYAGKSRGKVRGRVHTIGEEGRLERGICGGRSTDRG